MRARNTFFALVLLFSAVAYGGAGGGGSATCSFEKLGSARGIFDNLDKQIVDRGLKQWYRLNQPKLEQWQTISDNQVLSVKSDLVETLGLQDDVVPDKIEIGVNGDGTITIKHGRGSYLFTP